MGSQVIPIYLQQSTSFIKKIVSQTTYEYLCPAGAGGGGVKVISCSFLTYTQTHTNFFRLNYIKQKSKGQTKRKRGKKELNTNMQRTQLTVQY